MIVPQSPTTVTRSGWTSPVSGSTSTTAIWVPYENVFASGWKYSVAARSCDETPSGSGCPGATRFATSPSVTARDGAPTTVTRPLSSRRSSGEASSMDAATSIAFSRTDREASRTALPPTEAIRLAYVPTP